MTAQSYYFIGIGGSGMKPLAKLAAMEGFRVAGADQSLSDSLRSDFRELEIEAFHTHEPSRIDNYDVVVYSTAISSSHSELERAHKLEAEGKIEVIHRMEMLNRLTDPCKIKIGIAGTHGKTSTSSMLGWLLLQSGLDPHIVVGGRPAYLPEGVRKGSGRVAVFETDESDGSFLKSRADLRLILNVDSDHIEFYGSEERLKEAFVEFSKGGDLVVVNREDQFLRELADTSGDLQTYGEGKSVISDVSYVEQTDEMKIQGSHLRLRLPGRHFASNALGLLSLMQAATERGYFTREEFSLEKSVKILNEFPGVERRIEYLGEKNGVAVYDDYGHHPTEIHAVISALKGRFSTRGKIIAVFQPHRYTRTARHFREFARELDLADRVYLLPLFSAGEDPIDGVNANSILNAFSSRSKCTMLPAENFEKIFESATAGDTVICLGAGDITYRIRSVMGL